MRKLRHEEIPRPDSETAHSLAGHPVSALLDDVRSIYNVGAMFRASDAALVEKLYLTGITGTPENRGLRKTALGAQDTVRWEYQADPLPVVQALKCKGYTIGALEITDSPTLTTDVEESFFPLCLIVGNELRGVREQLVAEADVAFEIPQFGAKQSLNAAVAYGVAIFDIVRAYRRFAGLDSRPLPAGTGFQEAHHG